METEVREVTGRYSVGFEDGGRAHEARNVAIPWELNKTVEWILL